MTSIRFHIGRWADNPDEMIKAVSDYLGHLKIEAEPGHDCVLSLELAIVPNPVSGAPQREHEQAPKVVSGNDGVDDTVSRPAVVFQRGNIPISLDHLYNPRVGNNSFFSSANFSSTNPESTAVKA